VILGALVPWWQNFFMMNPRNTRNTRKRLATDKTQTNTDIFIIIHQSAFSILHSNLTTHHSPVFVLVSLVPWWQNFFMMNLETQKISHGQNTSSLHYIRAGNGFLNFCNLTKI
jgi:hypothetical protein